FITLPEVREIFNAQHRCLSKLLTQASKNMGESWVVLGWFLQKVGAKLVVFCRKLRFLKKACRAFGPVLWTQKIYVNLYGTAD
ncbi:MAG: hypothetical protein JXD22_08120, partial [Sedimentisphaerales bacterium]|nr:hypothetical protein [Sedimentisphaerales bacterium]